MENNFEKTLNVLQEDILSESAEELVKIVYGDKDRPGAKSLIAKAARWFISPSTDSTGAVYNAKHVEKELTKYGLDSSQVHDVRDAMVKSMKMSVDRIQKKHKIPDKYVAINSDSFGVYKFFLNVDDEVRDESYTLARKLFGLKLKKLGY